MLVGANLTTSHDGKASWESLRIVRDGDAWVYWAAPMGRAPVPFRLVESSVGRAVFANAERAFPNRISYWRDGADLLARIEGTVQERSVAENWRFSPGNATDCAPSACRAPGHGLPANALVNPSIRSPCAVGAIQGRHHGNEIQRERPHR